MAEFKTRTIVDDDGFEIEIKVPCHWEICGTCRGSGAHSHHIGAITSDEWDQWDCEEQENYMGGRYDRTCEDCGGSGKVQEEDYEKLPPKERAMLEAWDRDDAEYYRLCESERRAGC